MIWLAATLVYTAVGLIAARLVAGHLAWSWRMSHWTQERIHWPTLTSPRPPPMPTGEQWFGAACVGLLAGMLWPLTILLWLSGSERWAIGAEAEAISEKRARRIADLERELEIR